MSSPCSPLEGPVEHWLKTLGYEVIFRSIGWTECLVWVESERWQGRGGTRDAALQDVIALMFPSRAARLAIPAGLHDARAPIEGDNEVIAPTSRDTIALPPPYDPASGLPTPLVVAADSFVSDESSGAIDGGAGQVRPTHLQEPVAEKAAPRFVASVGDCLRRLEPLEDRIAGLLSERADLAAARAALEAERDETRASLAAA